jgi:hypothetical protein
MYSYLHKSIQIQDDKTFCVANVSDLKEVELIFERPL